WHPVLRDRRTPASLRRQSEDNSGCGSRDTGFVSRVAMSCVSGHRSVAFVFYLVVLVVEKNGPAGPTHGAPSGVGFKAPIPVSADVDSSLTPAGLEAAKEH